MGYAGSIAFPATPYIGNETATWSFDVLPGLYRISATWNSGYYTYGSNVPMTVLDGNTTVGSAILNQTLSPNDFDDQGTGGKISVYSPYRRSARMTDNANGIPIADAIRVERMKTCPIRPSSITLVLHNRHLVRLQFSGLCRKYCFPATPYNGNDGHLVV
ncbi:MAG: hypothetical protein R3C56_39175 [Pirellulaceae bacterium]